MSSQLANPTYDSQSFVNFLTQDLDNMDLMFNSWEENAFETPIQDLEVDEDDVEELSGKSNTYYGSSAYIKKSAS